MARDSLGRKHIKYSEIFYSFQGEGYFTGVPTVWLRLWSCNLECSGFGQKEPNKASTWELPYKTVDISKITKLEELPVFNYGCDSSYSWSSKFKHLAHTNTVDEVVDRLINLLPNKSFTQNNKYPDSKDIHLAFTGGEPMLWQDSMIEVVTEMINRGNFPHRITVETNGTKKLSESLKKSIETWHRAFDIRWFWSISPKLYYVSGEQLAVDLDVIASYTDVGYFSQLKFVLNNTESAWDEVDMYVKRLEDEYMINNVPIYIMPVGATVDSQTGTINKDLAEIANKALARGWRVSGRLHANIYGNSIGT